jgi:hypothetical protein
MTGGAVLRSIVEGVRGKQQRVCTKYLWIVTHGPKIFEVYLTLLG